MNAGIRFLGLAVFVLQAASAYSITLNVSPGGELDSLSAARDEVRQLRQAGTNDDIIVEFQSGTYVVTNTVIFTTEDSAPTNARTIYRAAPGATPIISGGQMITNWVKLTSYPVGLPANAQEKVWKADVPSWVTSTHKFHTLFSGDTMLQRSQSSTSEKTYPVSTDMDIKRIEFEDKNGVFKDWPNPTDIDIRLILNNKDWQFNILPVESFDVTSNRVRLAQPAMAALTSDDKFTVENAIDYLDQAGEWVVNTLDGAVYYWPKSGDPTNMIAPTLSELVRIEGVNDQTALTNGYVAQDIPVRGLVFEGLTFTHADRYEYEDGDIGLQHEWDLYDKANGLLRFRGAEDCVVSDCTFKNTGSGGIRMDLYCRNIIIENSLFDNLGGTGICLAGYGPGLKDVNRDNTIVNNIIERVGRIWVESPGIFLSRSGNNHIAHNRIKDSKFNGLVISGMRATPMGYKPSERTYVLKDRSETLCIREAEITYSWSGEPDWSAYQQYIHARNNVIEYNEIHDVANLMKSGNNIYTSGTGDNNLIQYNVFYDQEKANSLIRNDIGSNHVKIFQNIFFGTEVSNKSTPPSSQFLTMKETNYANNNIIVNCVMGKDASSAVATFKKNIYYYSAAPVISEYHLSGAKFDDNVFYHSVSNVAATCLTNQQANGADANSVALGPNDPPLFQNVAQGNFDLQTNSPATLLGITPITADEFAQVGTFNGSFLEHFLWNVNHFLYNADEVDTDTDGLTDAWELYYFGNLDQGATDDPDGDGDDNATEFSTRTDPNYNDARGITDKDNDGIDDRWEVAHFGSTYACGGGSDRDHDGTPNFLEYLYGSDPTDPSSRGFGLAAGMHDDGTSVACDWSVREDFVLGRHYGVAISSNLVTWDVLPGQYSLNQSTNSGMTKLEIILPDEYGPSAFFKFSKP